MSVLDRAQHVNPTAITIYMEIAGLNTHEKTRRKGFGSSGFFFFCYYSSERGKRLSVLRQLMLDKELEALGLQECSGKTGSPDLPRVKVAE